VASLIASKVTGKDWETLIREELFEPLKMQSAGFGPPGVDGDMSQPWGHVRGSRKTFVASQKDNAPALGPAGTIHVTLRDWCQFANVFTGNQPEGYLTAGALEQLLAAPKGGDYSCGWILVERSWAGGVALTHSGSNTMWMSTIWIAPKTKRVYIAATNVGGSGIGKMVDEIIGKLIKFDGR
jgi:CubicO group peptidase (beta-lactamase class C family)